MLGAGLEQVGLEGPTNGEKMAPSVLFSWVMLSIIVGVAAGTRGHNGAWFLLALIISPLLAALCLIVLPHRLSRGRPSNAEAGALAAAALTADRIDYWNSSTCDPVLARGPSVSTQVESCSTPTRSFFQTDCIALKMILRCGWAMRATAAAEA
jgi:hypothetical protein